MKLLDLNRNGGIGASCHLVQLGDVRIVIDCGLHPKLSGPEATPDFSPLLGLDVDLIVITHCHLDHIGSLPLLLRQQLRAPVVMTASSAMLIGRMLHNSASVMERQRAEQGRSDLALFAHEEVDRIALDIKGGRKEGYRAWTHKQNFPPNPVGCWQVRVLTEDGQMIGVLRFRVTDADQSSSASSQAN